ncbi:MAG: hypothetical protein NC483_00670 [Ruminococcus sp.]|nr:hypothetical protein [Ruminococcus sp.]
MAKNLLNNYLELSKEDKESFLKLIKEGLEVKDSIFKFVNGRYEFEHKGIKYVEFKKTDNEISFISKDILSKEIMEDIVEDKKYLDSSSDVRYSSNIFDNSWENSFVRKILNEKFKDKYLDDLNLINEVGCLTKEEAENLPQELKQTDDNRYGYWTMTPYNDMNSLDRGECATVFYVDSSGYLGNHRVDNAFGVRPVITLSTDEL